MFKLDMRGLLCCLGLVWFTTQSMAQVESANEEKAEQLAKKIIFEIKEIIA